MNKPKTINDKHNLLLSIYEELYGFPETSTKKANLTKLSGLLLNLTGKEWTVVYLNNLLMGYKGFRITEDLEKALMALAGKLDGDPPLKALITKSVMVYSLNGLKDGAIVLAHSRQCPQCFVEFVPNVWNKKYCCEECKRIHRKEKNERRKQ